jgi:DNA-binding NarL/FixJ family response regulator
MRRIRVVVVDDHGLMIEAVRLAMSREPDIEIVGEARNGRDVLAEVARRQPDIVLLDIRMPDVDGLSVLDELRGRHPRVKVVMLTGVSDPEMAREAFERGAVAYLEKTVDPATMTAQLRQLAAERPARGEPGGAARPANAGANLTPREREILVLVGEGKSNPEIAAALWLTEQTVKYHLTKVYRKLGVTGRAGAVRYFFECDPARSSR